MNDTTFPEDFSNFVIGQKYSTLKADRSTTNASAALSLISQARQSIDIFSHDLDPRILNSTEISDAVKQFIKISSKSKIRILISDPDQPLKRGHCLIELSRRFSSFISIRTTNVDYQSTAYSFLMVDHKALLYRPNSNQYLALVNFSAQSECRQYREFFNTVWDNSEPASEIRQLFI
ncbi:MAG: hypothetical protein ACI9N9_001773 [Enterobacterales bacterium]|jgi:hypothetical protein